MGAAGIAASNATSGSATARGATALATCLPTAAAAALSAGLTATLPGVMAPSAGARVAAAADSALAAGGETENQQTAPPDRVSCIHELARLQMKCLAPLGSAAFPEPPAEIAAFAFADRKTE